jgi:hypothetical protein
MFNGSHGRLELEVIESEHRDAVVGHEMDGIIHGIAAFPNVGDGTVILQKLWQKPEKLPIVMDHVGHYGGDKRMFNALFGPLPGEAAETGDASKQSATERDGALAPAVGLMADESFRTGKFVELKSLNLPL